MNWTNYLPSVLQQVQVYWTIGVCVATVCALQTIPENFRRPWIIQLLTFSVALIFSFWLIGFNVYGFGSALICSSLSTSFYDIAFSAIAARVRAFLGVTSSDPTLTVSRPANPENIEKK